MIRSAVIVKLIFPRLRADQAIKMRNKCSHQKFHSTANGHYATSIGMNAEKVLGCCVKIPYHMNGHEMTPLLNNKRTYTNKKDDASKITDPTCTIMDQTTPMTVKDSERVSINRENPIFIPPEVTDDDPGTLLTSKSVDPEKTMTQEEIGRKIGAKKPRPKYDHNYKSVERNFITAVRAMNEYLLKPSDLEGLRKTVRRSPFDNAPSIAVYLRKDVDAKALQVHGSREALLRELRKKQEQDRQYKELFSNSDFFQIKMTVKEYQEKEALHLKKKRRSLFHGSGRVVLTAVVINASNFTLKLLAWMYTGSHSLFSEAIHSLADTLNQLILAYGIHQSDKAPDKDHPYGYMNLRYVASLISGVGIFCFGTGLSFYHGVIGLMSDEPVQSLYWAFFILGGALVSEGATLLIAFNAVRRGAEKMNMSVIDYVKRAHDPMVNVVLLEDIAAVLGVGIAASCMGLSTVLNSNVPDAVGSIVIGCLLGAVAAFIISTNSAALVGRSIPSARLEIINRELETDVMIRAIHDAKCLDMGNGQARYKAEIDFDGRELSKSYLDKQDLELLLEEMRKMQTMEEVEIFMLKHGENVIDLVGAEIDRIENGLKKKYPEIRHCDLEIL